jgi:DNA-binding CsgD family transcriptional regulator
MFSPKVVSTTLHRQDGRIGFIAIKWGEHFSYVNPVDRFPWDYIAKKDRDRVREWFRLVAGGSVSGVIRYMLDNVGAPDEWICETAWHRVPGSEFPILGTSEAWNAVVESLSKRERQVAKLLALYTVKEISAALETTVSNVDKIRHRIGEKVDLLGPALVAWCQSHGDVL